MLSVVVAEWAVVEGAARFRVWSWWKEVTAALWCISL